MPIAEKSASLSATFSLKMYFEKFGVKMAQKCSFYFHPNIFVGHFFCLSLNFICVHSVLRPPVRSKVEIKF